MTFVPRETFFNASKYSVLAYELSFQLGARSFQPPKTTEAAFCSKLVWFDVSRETFHRPSRRSAASTEAGASPRQTKRRKQNTSCFNTTNLFSAFMFHVKHGSPSKSDKIKCFTWNKPAYKITPRFDRTGYPDPLTKRYTVSPPRSSARTQRHSRLSSAAKGIAPKFAACFWNSDFPFIPLLQAFDMLCACMYRNSAKNCFTWNNPFKGRKNSPKKIGIQDQPAPFIKCEHSVLIGKYAHRPLPALFAPPYKLVPPSLKFFTKNPQITPQLTAIKSKARRWIHS